uniref:Ribosomal protein S11 n=1 Tax=Vertebrata lanosa TaxID=1261582 RepID=A0A1J0F7H9_9FLOR|nr:ribosomal protein S11 [Vertebrata lanosa]APC24952.1 ribosomal protein S11 [Vertebrata lanosa]
MQIYFLFILFNQNNIFLTLTNVKGSIFFWKSIGMTKTKGLKKLLVSNIKNFVFLNLNIVKSNSLIRIHLKLKGFNKCKKTFTKILLTFLGSKILSICDNSLKPNNGCKLKKNRRL